MRAVGRHYAEACVQLMSEMSSTDDSQVILGECVYAGRIKTTATTIRTTKAVEASIRDHGGEETIAQMQTETFKTIKSLDRTGARGKGPDSSSKREVCSSKKLEVTVGQVGPRR
jgi:hypothetical protein